ncbi:uncharacterized protein LOC101204826 [Cucumis sativus]|uniref:Uncharacterized protein n=1 Tax=Cucumis sativus TaxID=3659 RepID=A0A0A0KMY4_CUCSA|nr:uncharacterized protein LOC101204826 [Cucumis sativus]
MKKLCRKSTVHPSPPIISDFLSFLPAAIFALTLALSADDKEVLAYLISCSNSTASLSNLSGGRKNGRKIAALKVGVDHAPLFDCDCFMCYRRYWARWDSSPNRQLIHEIIDAYEDGLTKSKATTSTQRNCKKERRKKNNESGSGESSSGKGKTNEVLLDSVQETGRQRNEKEEEEEEEGEGEERGSVRRFVSFVGEKIWGAWG